MIRQCVDFLTDCKLCWLTPNWLGQSTDGLLKQSTNYSAVCKLLLNSLPDHWLGSSCTCRSLDRLSNRLVGQLETVNRLPNWLTNLLTNGPTCRLMAQPINWWPNLSTDCPISKCKKYHVHSTFSQGYRTCTVILQTVIQYINVLYVVCRKECISHSFLPKHV